MSKKSDTSFTQTLPDSARWLDWIVDHSPLAIFACDADGVIMLWNPACERLYGWTAAEIIGRYVPAVPETSLAEAAEFRRRAINGESMTDVEVVRQHRDGSAIQLSLSNAPIYDPSGQVVGILCIAADITQRKLAKEALRVANETLSAIVQSSPVAKERQGQVFQYNIPFVTKQSRI